MHSPVPMTMAAAPAVPAGLAVAQAGDPSSWPVGVAPAGDGAQAASPRQVEQLRTELRQEQAMVGLLRQRLADAEMVNSLLPWLLLVLTGCVALAVWLALRVRRLQRDQARRSRVERDTLARADRPASEPPGAPPIWQTSGADDVVPGNEGQPARAAADAGAVTGAGRSPGGHASAAAPLSVGELTQVQPVRALTVEELLDLEQQVDFFLVLGQEEAAIDLLVSHIRDTGGTSALPFLKLMDVYRHQGNGEGFERIRQRFNQRFNAYAPDFATEVEAGQGLPQYPKVVERLQRLWPKPLDAMAALEALLFRRSGGELFDLPAYRDLLLLYALARDLHERESVSMMRVDVLLPLGDDPMETTSPRPHLAEPRGDAQALLAEWGSSFEPVSRGAAAASGAASGLDLDLSEFAPAPREFTRPAAFIEADLRRDDWRTGLASVDERPEPPRER